MAIECKKHKSQGQRKKYTCVDCRNNFKKEWIKGECCGIQAHECRGKDGMNGFRNHDDFIQWCNREDAKHKLKLKLLNSDNEEPCTISQTTRRKDPPKPILYTQTGIDVQCVRQILTKSLAYTNDAWIMPQILPDRKRKLANEDICIPKFIEQKSFAKFGHTKRSPNGLADIFGPIVEHNMKRVIFARVTYLTKKTLKEFRILLQLRFDSEDKTHYTLNLDTQRKSNEAANWQIFADLDKTDENINEIREVLREMGL